VAQIDAVLRKEIDELADDFGRTLKGWIGQATTSKADLTPAFGGQRFYAAVRG
jgi:hypothetical protein